MNTTLKAAAALTVVLGGAFAVWETFFAEELESLEPVAVLEQGPTGELPPATGGAPLLAPDLPESEAGAGRREELGGAAAAALEPEWVVHGTVKRSYDEPYPHVPVVVRLWEGYEVSGEPVLERELRCGAEGEFELPLEDPGRTVSLRVEVPEEGHYHWRSGELVVRGEVPQGVVLHAFPFDCTLVGRVHGPDGTPVAGAAIRGTGETVESDASGRYRLPMPSSVQRHFISALADGLSSKRLVVAELAPGEEREFDIELRPDFRVFGKVEDQSGRPLEGVRVSSFYSAHTAAHTDARGEFVVRGLDPDREEHMVSARAEGFVMQTVDVATTRSGEARQDFVLGRGVRVAGFVVDEAGAPLPGASLYIGFSPSAFDRVDAVARDDGSFEFPAVASGSRTLVVQRDGFAPHNRVLEVPDSSDPFPELTITLGQAHFIAGRVVDEEDRPRAGVNVSMRYRGEYIDGRTRTDDSGRFRVEGLPAEELAVELWGKGLVRTDVALDGVDREDYVFVVPGAGRLSGRVLDAATGDPVSAFRVRFVDPVQQAGDRRLTGFSATWSREGHSFEDPEGRWDTDDAELAPGAVIGIEVQAEGFAVARLERVAVPAPGVEEQLELALQRGTSVAGRVVDEQSGAPVAGASLRLYPASTNLGRLHDGDPHGPPVVQTDASGEFLVRNGPVGSVQLLVEHPDFPVHVDGPFELDGRAADVRREVALPPGAVLSGRSLDPGGQARSGETVELRLAGSGHQVTRQWQRLTDADGGYRFDRLPGGDYVLARRRTVGATTLTLLSVDLELSTGEQRELDLRASGSGVVSGRLLCEDGLPEHCAVRLRLWEHPSGAVAVPGSGGQSYGTLAVDGAFELSGLAPGTYRLWVFHTNWTSGESWRAVEEHVLRIEPGDRLERDVLLEHSQQ